MPPTVACCLHNVTAEFRALARDADVRFRPAPCKEHCGICHDGPFLVVDGEVRTGPDHETILGSIEGVDVDSEADPDGGDSDGGSGPAAAAAERGSNGEVRRS